VKFPGNDRSVLLQLNHIQMTVQEIRKSTLYSGWNFLLLSSSKCLEISRTTSVRFVEKAVGIRAFTHCPFYPSPSSGPPSPLPFPSLPNPSVRPCSQPFPSPPSVPLMTARESGERYSSSSWSGRSPSAKRIFVQFTAPNLQIFRKFHPMNKTPMQHFNDFRNADCP